MLVNVLIFLFGVVIGCVLTRLIITFRSGRGYFRVSKIPEEDELYTINVRLEPDQQLQKKHQILLKREHSPK